ncbi:universal stress protein [Streptomyces sp. NPDC088560]|uniref:universal stress protein n=1 Tax=Streptomyces sp. NPDC088560 TaxID=3365868 RepID=UPI0037F4708C
MVVGSRGRGGIRELALGSVSHALLQYFMWPMAVIRPRTQPAPVMTHPPLVRQAAWGGVERQSRQGDVIRPTWLCAGPAGPDRPSPKPSNREKGLCEPLSSRNASRRPDLGHCGVPLIPFHAADTQGLGGPRRPDKNDGYAGADRTLARGLVVRARAAPAEPQWEQEPQEVSPVATSASRSSGSTSAVSCSASENSGMCRTRANGS